YGTARRGCRLRRGRARTLPPPCRRRSRCSIRSPHPSGIPTMSRHRTHNCAALSKEHVDQSVRLAGWVHRKRDHGNLLFVDLRDNYGITQCVVTPGSAAFEVASSVKVETVISVGGKVVLRTPENVNPAISTGGIELDVAEIEVLSAADPLPFQVNAAGNAP